MKEADVLRLRDLNDHLDRLERQALAAEIDAALWAQAQSDVARALYQQRGAILEALERNQRLEAVVLGFRPGPGAGGSVTVGDLVDAERERDRLEGLLEDLQSAHGQLADEHQRISSEAESWRRLHDDLRQRLDRSQGDHA